MTMQLKLDDGIHDLRIVVRKPALIASLGDHTFELEELEADHGPDHCAVTLCVGDHKVQAWRYVDGDRVFLHIGGRTFTVDYVDPVIAAEEVGEAGNIIKAPMPGIVVDVHLEAGAPVTTGTAILTVESMKLQSTIIAPRDGHVEAILVAPGEAFERDAVLATLSADEETK